MEETIIRQRSMRKLGTLLFFLLIMMTVASLKIASVRDDNWDVKRPVQMELTTNQ